MDLLKVWLPDIPRWVEARDLVLSEAYEVFGSEQPDGRGLVLRNHNEDVSFIVGKPDPQTIFNAIGSGDVIAGIESRGWLSDLLTGWRGEAARVLVMENPRLSANNPDVRIVTLTEIEQALDDEDLLEELRAAAEFTEIAASFEASRPVSFCYASAETETLWDVGIDTLETHRRRGHAHRVASFMIRRMKDRGLDVVWTALESNLASLQLAASLGLAEVDQIVIFQSA